MKSSAPKSTDDRLHKILDATDPTGNQNWATEKNSAELDMTGTDMKKEDPGDETLLQPDSNDPTFPATGNPARLNGGCTFNNIPIGDCGFLMGSSSFDRFNLVSAASEASAPRLQ